MKRLRHLLCAALAFLPLLATPLAAQALPVPAPATARSSAFQITVAPDRDDWTYPVGAPVRFLVRVTADGRPASGLEVQYTIAPDMVRTDARTAKLDAAGTLELDGGTMNAPGFLRCKITYEDGGRRFRGIATAGFSPEKIQPTQTEPADFDAFWNDGKAALAQVPIDAVVTLVPEQCTATVDVYHVGLRNVGPVSVPAQHSRVYGMLAEPKAAGPFPAILQVPGAGVRGYAGAVERAAQGYIVFAIGIHGLPVNLPEGVYRDLGAGALEQYRFAGLEDRDTCYYRRVYLGCIRANDFLVSRPKFDGRNLFVTGGSQGGQLSIVTAALDPRVQALAAFYPAYCDVTGYLHGRAGGWPGMFRPQVDGQPSVHNTPAKIATSAYYDTVNFARRLKAPGFFWWGYNDETCPSTSMFAAYNVITAPKSLTISVTQGHNGLPEQQQAADKWIDAAGGRAAAK